MGELQQVNIEKQVLKQAQLHTQILRQIEQNQRLAPGAGAPVNFGFQ